MVLRVHPSELPNTESLLYPLAIPSMSKQGPITNPGFIIDGQHVARSISVCKIAQSRMRHDQESLLPILKNPYMEYLPTPIISS